MKYTNNNHERKAMSFGKQTVVVMPLLIAALSMTSCAEDAHVRNHVADRSVTFHAQMDQPQLTRSAGKVQTVQLSEGPQALYMHRIVEPWGGTPAGVTRGTLVNPTESNMTPTDFTFGVSGYTYNTASGSTLTDRTANFFYNKKVQRQGVEGFWKTVDATYYWPSGSDKLAFYGYYPYQADDAAEVLQVWGDGTTEDDKAPLRIHYRVNSNISSQKDLMTAYTTNQSFNQSSHVPLTFRHALTAVNLQLGDNVAPGKLKYVALNNIFNEGMLTVSGNDGTKTRGAWNFSGMSSTTVKIDFTTDGTHGGFNTETGGKDLLAEPLFVIPQHFGSQEQTISIVLNDSETGDDIDGAHPLSMPLSTFGDWEAGTKVTYLINTNSINVVHMESIQYPASWDGDAFSVKTAYADGDEIGVFAVDESGKVTKANKKFRYNGSSWIDTERTDTLLYNPANAYYVYYPYKATLEGAPKVGDSFNENPSAENVEDKFFANVISQWAVSSDQSTREKLLANDLQIAKATAGSKMLQLKASMKHTLGLTKLELGVKTITASVTYTPGGTSTGSAYTRSGETVYVSATEQMAPLAIQPCLYDLDYYYISSIAQNLTFKSVQGLFNTWKEDVAVTTADKGTCSVYTAQPNDNVANYAYQGKFFSYTGNIQSLAIDNYGRYTLEVWGAQGGTYGSCVGGRGGYSAGMKILSSGNTLYIGVGSQGACQIYGGNVANGGYNGGGYGYNMNISGACGGGGATHICINNNRGVLSQYTNNRDEVLIVAGGGAGGYWYNGMRVTGNGNVGGGLTGGYSYNINYRGTQTSGYAFGQGGDGWAWQVTNSNRSGGGGGWYGGYGIWAEIGAGGGSGYIGGVMNGSSIMGSATFRNTGASGTETGHAGNGYARIVIPIPVGQ